MKNQCSILWNMLFCLLHFTNSLLRYRLLYPLTVSLHFLSQSSSQIVCFLNYSNLFLHFSSLFIVDLVFILLLRVLNYDSCCFFMSISLMILSLAVSRQASSTPFSAYSLLSLLKDVQKQSSGLLFLDCLFLVDKSVLSMVALNGPSGMNASCFFSTILCNLFLRYKLMSSWYRSCSSFSTAETERIWTKLLLLPVVLRVSLMGLFIRGVVCGRRMLKRDSSWSKGDSDYFCAHRRARVGWLAVWGCFSGFLGFLCSIKFILLEADHKVQPSHEHKQAPSLRRVYKYLPILLYHSNFPLLFNQNDVCVCAIIRIQQQCCLPQTSELPARHTAS